MLVDQLQCFEEKKSRLLFNINVFLIRKGGGERNRDGRSKRIPFFINFNSLEYINLNIQE